MDMFHQVQERWGVDFFAINKCYVRSKLRGIEEREREREKERFSINFL